MISVNVHMPASPLSAKLQRMLNEVLQRLRNFLNRRCMVCMTDERVCSAEETRIIKRQRTVYLATSFFVFGAAK
jgi:DNA-directed RNA polymerase subunit E'/Rpb7